jgi:hypothetical protein
VETPTSLPESRLTRRRARGYRALPLAATLSCLALAPAGCGGGSGTAPASAGGAAGSGAPGVEAYAKCMRSHGVPTFPDPNSKGQVSPSSIVNLNSPQYRKAQEVCRSLAPRGGQTVGGSGSLTPQQQAQFLRFARCMRAHGVSKFPDPTSSGMSLSGVDPSSPQFQSAQTVCRSVLPNRGRGNFQSTGGSVKP